MPSLACNANNLNWQVIVTSDGCAHKLPTNLPQSVVNAYIDMYEDMLDMQRRIDERDSLQNHHYV